MANCKIVFLGTERSKTDDTELECFVNGSGEIFIEIKESGHMSGYGLQFICLDKSTAIKFSKALRTEISKIVD
jgi:hypothetical protein